MPRHIRRHITTTRNRILAAVECAIEAGVITPELLAQGVQARQLAALKATDRDPVRLSPIATRLDELQEQAERLISVLLPVETDPSGPVRLAPNTTTNRTALANASETEGASRPSALDASSSRHRSPSLRPISSPDCPLRGFQATPSFILQIAAPFRDLCGSARPSERQVIDAAPYVAQHLGISTHAYGQACALLGRYGAAVTIAVIAARHAAGKVRTAGGLLREMVKRHQQGTLNLDRTLFGLADSLASHANY